MSVHQKENGTWFVQYRAIGFSSPKREYFGVGEPAHEQAKARDAEIKLLKSRGIVTTLPDKLYLDTLAQQYLSERKIQGASQRWLDEMQFLFNKRILPYLSSVPVENLKYTDIVVIIEKYWNNSALATRQRYLAYLKACFNFGLRHGLLATHPLTNWRPKVEKKKPFTLTLANLHALWACAAPHLQWVITVEWEVGARPGASELFALKWIHIDYAALTIHIPGTKTSTSNRTLPISPSFAAKLKKRQALAQSSYIIDYKGQPVKSVKTALRKARERAGIESAVRLYDIRHLFASTMLAGGADLAAVSKLLGHASIATTQKHYYHLLAGEMARAIASKPDLN